MAFAFFRISAGDVDAIEDLNELIARHSVIRIERQFHVSEGEGYWSFCVEYRPRQKAQSNRKGDAERIDYRDVLNEEEFLVYASLRDVRKAISEREGVPLFAIAVNEQLADIARKKVANKAGFREVADFGESRVRKYADEFLAALNPRGSAVSEVTAVNMVVTEGKEHAEANKGGALRSRELFESE